MFITWGEIKNLINFISFILNIYTVFSFCCCGAFLYLHSTRKTLLCDFPTCPINPCQHVVLYLIIRLAMITLNMIINISYKTFGYCTTIGRILIKINIHCPKFFINVVLYFSELEKFHLLMMHFLH